MNEVQKLKFYQKGTLTVGNRLVDEASAPCRRASHRSNSLTSGHRACQGCGEALGARYAIDAAMRATGGKLIAVNATGCLEVFTTPYPETSWQMPWMHSLFGNAAAVATGVAAAMRVHGPRRRRVVAQGGDGGTTDIGFGCLSGMFERNDDVLYICYDNEGYMNTGVQRSSATPPAARTATTPALGTEPGNVFGTGKFVPKIAVAHEIPYVATASVADLHDLEAKVTQGHGLPRRALHPDQRALPARLGRGARTTRSSSRGSPSRPACSRSSRPRTASVTQRAQDPPPDAGRRISEAAAPLRPSVRATAARTRASRALQAHRRPHIAEYGLAGSRRLARRLP